MRGGGVPSRARGSWRPEASREATGAVLLKPRADDSVDAEALADGIR